MDFTLVEMVATQWFLCMGYRGSEIRGAWLRHGTISVNFRWDGNRAEFSDVSTISGLACKGTGLR